ncbi:succinate dehydrogenase, cytochrome b556 subunit [Gilvimarinus polysaccharolyticus]|uniref:succinate dehydrogenase, cytochrome b556 subunit n=1 Tax=Gilvimarinus polysaccharolyticus TaxID=863921 RepID=UPI0006735698|nr:succinate dehydrogenase, cytochrome b556 subunit [Gilvimarinus polysaccharolyticus]
MNNNRPVNLDLSTIKFPITAIVSILHRASGVFIFAGVAVLLWMLDSSLSSEEGFAAVQDALASPICKFIIWAVLAGLAYHLAAGVRHLIMDCGVGESLEGGRLGAKLMLVCAVILMLLAGVWVW